MSVQNTNNKLSRREAIKLVGTISLSTVGALTAGNVLSSCSANDSNPSSTISQNSMKVLLLNGSGREKGCTFTALSEVADTLNRNGVATEIK